MAGFSMEEASQILKIDYLPVVRDQIPTKTPLFSRLNKGTEDVVGSEAQFVIRTNRNQGVGARPNGAPLPAAGSQKYRKVSVETKNLYGRIEIAGKVFKAAANNRGAFINAVEAELKGLVESLQWDLNRELFNVPTGTLATLSAGASTNTLTVASSNASFPTRWIVKDMLVDIYKSDGTTPIATARKVLAVDKATNTFTIEGAEVTVSAGDIVVRAGSLDSEIIGLKQILTPGTTLYGIDRSDPANAYFNPQLLTSATDRAISEVLIQQGIDEVEINAGGTITLMISDHGVRRAYQDLLQALKRYTEPKRLTGGWTALDYNGIDWVADADCAANTLYGLDESTFKIHTMIPEVFDWGEEDNQILRQVSGHDAYEAFMVGYLELACDAPAKNFVIDKITEK